MRRNSIPCPIILKRHQQRKPKKSDHRTLLLDLNIQFTKIKPDTREFFNLKSESCQEIFKRIIDNETNLVDCLTSELPLNEKAKIWYKTLQGQGFNE